MDLALYDALLDLRLRQTHLTRMRGRFEVSPPPLPALLLTLTSVLRPRSQLPVVQPLLLGALLLGGSTAKEDEKAADSTWDPHSVLTETLDPAGRKPEPFEAGG